MQQIFPEHCAILTIPSCQKTRVIHNCMVENHLVRAAQMKNVFPRGKGDPDGEGEGNYKSSSSSLA